VDVACDVFRSKSDAGYLCAECDFHEVEKVERTRALVRRLLTIAVTLVLGGLVMTSLLYVARHLPVEKVVTKPSRK
jgi:hypothetical protein